MSVIRKPQISAAIIAAISLFYAAVFIFTSEHTEFVHILAQGGTLSSPFWNGWSDFLRQGNMKYVGYAYLVSAAFLVILSWFRKQDYDEYQTGILEKGFLVTGVVMVLLFPVAMFMILSDSNYSVEVILLLVVVHWSAALIFDLIYAVTCGR